MNSQNNSTVRIGTIKTAAFKGERVAVYFANGQQGSFIAQNDITSSLVAVIGDRVWSEDVAVPRLTTTTKLYKSRSTSKNISGQIVSASVLIGFIPTNLYPDPPYNSFDRRTAIALEHPSLSWDFVNTNQKPGLCISNGYGAGQYASAEECLSANPSGLEYPIFPPFEADNPYIFRDSDGLLKNKFANAGYLPGKQFKVKIVLSFIQISGPLVLLAYLDERGIRRKFYRLDQGALRYFENGIEREFPVDEFALTQEDFGGAVRATYTKELILNYESLASFTPPAIEVDYQKASNYNERDSLTYRRSESVTQLSLNVSYYRKTAIEYPLSSEIQTYFLKVHDPDLPLIKLYDLHPLLYHKAYFVFEGDRAYLILKVGKVRAPEIPERDRNFVEIVFVEAKIGSTKAEVVNVFTYNVENLRSGDLPSSFVLANIINNFADPSSDIYCLEPFDFELNPRLGNQTFRETSYQKRNGKIIEYKLRAKVF